jgi:hypothetical protein
MIVGHQGQGLARHNESVEFVREPLAPPLSGVGCVPCLAGMAFIKATP